MGNSSECEVETAQLFPKATATAMSSFFGINVLHFHHGQVMAA
jgi:hypothetical protein